MAQFARGTNSGSEYQRNDNSFYKGIVVKNWDPHKLQRVKIYVPEISNQPLEDWLQEYKNINVRFPGKNNKQDAWLDTDIYEEISKFLPWAEPCMSLLGESGPGRYWSQLGTAITTDSNYAEAFTHQFNNPDQTPDEREGVWGPSFLYEQEDTNTSDYFWNPTEENNYAVNNNPYSFHFRPSNHVDKSKGLFCVPSIGSQVWLFHYRGDYNFPVYIGGRSDRRMSSLIYNEDAPGGENGPPFGNINHSMDYPGVFENFPSTDDEIKRD